MAGVITTGNHPKALWPGIQAWFGASYKEYPEEYRDIFEVVKSTKGYEEDVGLSGFGLAAILFERLAISDRITHCVSDGGLVDSFTGEMILTRLR